MTKSYHINEMAISLILIDTVKSLNYCYNFWFVSETSLFFHQAPQVEKESAAEDIEILKNHFGQFHQMK